MVFLLIKLLTFYLCINLSFGDKIVLHSGAGGKSHIKAVLEIGKELKLRGHEIYYVAPKENVEYIAGYNFTFLASGSIVNDKWNVDTILDQLNGFDQPIDRFKLVTYIISNMIAGVYEDSFVSFKEILEELNPDLLFCDFFSPVCRDIGKLLNIPIINTFQHADMYGLQSNGVISNSFGLNDMYLNQCSFIVRLYEMIYLKLKEIYYFLPFINKMQQLRAKFNIPQSINPLGDWDKDLALANTFFPYEPILPIQPNFHMIGPIFNNNYIQLSNELDIFLNQHNNIVYVAFGSNVLLGNKIMTKFMTVLIEGLNKGLYNGIIFGLGLSKLNFELNVNNFNYTTQQLIENQHPNIRLLNWAPQQAILNHEHTKLFLSHCGLESTFESISAKKPLLCHPFLADQPRSSQKVIQMNVGLSIDIHQNTIKQIHYKINQLLNNNKFEMNLNRVNNIIKNRRNMKSQTADLVEAHLELTKLCSKDSTCYNAHLSKSESNFWKDYYLDIIGFLLTSIIIISIFFIYTFYKLFLRFQSKKLVYTVKKKKE
ncbi:UDP-Glycosyltransferase/glycogen phosphorylase [Neoconidiobolus thromboides FSU 785]|nr:UDP-Glycosyltransferase/glycogen phosphorylase [Neoconidiobolus thromboides FSU 785]